MKKRLAFMALVVYTTGLAQPLSTPSNLDEIKKDTLPELVVTAQRTPVSSLGVSEAIQLLSTKAIHRQQMRTTPEALAMLPGVFVQKTNHGGGSPFLRGLTGNQVLLLLDGIRLNNATFRYGPNQYLNTIDVLSLQGIEVLSGSGSVQFGSDALGGTVQALSRKLAFLPQKTHQTALLARATTHGMEQSLRAEHGYAYQRVALYGGVTARRFGDLVGGDTTGRQNPSGYRELDFDMKTKIALSKRSNLTLLHQNTHQFDVPIFHKIRLENFEINRFERQQRRLSYARWEHEFGGSSIWQKIEITASLQQTREVRESRKNGASVTRTEQDEVRGLGLVAQVRTGAGRWSGVHGIELCQDKVGSLRSDFDQKTGQNTSKRGLYPNGARMGSMALFSLNDWDFARWAVTLGARWNQFLVEVQDESIGKARLTPSALVGNVALARKFGTRARLFLSMNTGFRAPNIDDMGTLGIVDSRFETPNYTLRPETSVQTQLGGKVKADRWSAQVFVFRMELRDLIARVRRDTLTEQGYPVYQKANAERAYTQGIEANGGVQLGKSWLLEGNLCYTFGHNLTLQEPMRRIPPVFGRLALGYAPSQWFVRLEFLSAGAQHRLASGDISDNRIPAGGTPGWQVFNLHGGIQRKRYGLCLSALNLLHRDYRTHGSGINAVGRSGSVTLNLFF